MVIVSRLSLYEDTVETQSDHRGQYITIALYCASSCQERKHTKVNGFNKIYMTIISSVLDVLGHGGK